MNQETLFAILRLFLLPSMAKGSATTEVANEFALHAMRIIEIYNRTVNSN